MTKIDIISGFLGFGKTTFSNIYLRYLITNGIKTVYVVNEFGKVGLDAEIIEKKGFSAIELANGCVCCTLKAGVKTTLKEVIKTYNPERIVFEPSGVFVFNSFFDVLEDEELKTMCEIGCAITIVDSRAFHKIDSTPGSFLYNQIRNAKTLIISKLEKFKGEVDEIICDLRNLNAPALIISKPWTELNDDDLKLIYENEFTEFLHDKDSLTQTLVDHENIKSLTLFSGYNFDDEGYKKFVARLRGEKNGNIMRVKGYIKINNESYLFNMTATDVNLEPESYVQDYRLTFIGENLDEEGLKKAVLIGLVNITKNK